MLKALNDVIGTVQHFGLSWEIIKLHLRSQLYKLLATWQPSWKKINAFISLFGANLLLGHFFSTYSEQTDKCAKKLAQIDDVYIMINKQMHCPVYR